MPAAGSRTLAQNAGGKRNGVIWGLVKDVESVIKTLADGPGSKVRSGQVYYSAEV